ncbi:hypothetical protein [Streptomyces sp. NPDC059262]|uniref:hypothetical protein n=1 Tax=Streptomyces sp. NPDC059262 TaxID=3346797 RepID=UPI0036773F37
MLGPKASDVDRRVARRRLQPGKTGPPKTAKSRRAVPVGEVSERQAGPAVLGHASGVIKWCSYAQLWTSEKDRTRSVMDAVLGGLRTGCGPEDQATKEVAGQAA